MVSLFDFVNSVSFTHGRYVSTRTVGGQVTFQRQEVVRPLTPPPDYGSVIIHSLRHKTAHKNIQNI